MRKDELVNVKTKNTNRPEPEMGLVSSLTIIVRLVEGGTQW